MEMTPNNVLDREPQLSDLTIQGLRYYEDSLKDLLERDHYGAVVAIQPYSGEYAVGTDSDNAVRAIRARNVHGRVFVRRIGQPTEEDNRFAARLAASEAKAK